MTAASYAAADDAVVTGSRGDLLEGPIWLPRSGTAMWVDLFAGTVHRADVETRRSEQVAALGEETGLVVATSTEDLLVVTSSGVCEVCPDGTHRLVTAVEADDETRRPNDGACAPDGRLWFSTVRDDHAVGEGRLYSWSDGDLRLEASGFALPNGMDWSPGREHFYLVDSVTRSVGRWTWRDGRLDGEPTAFVQLSDSDGLPDGLTVDTDGGVWIAVFDAGEVRRYDPDGRLERAVRLPVTRVTSCAFVGADLDRLLVTTASRELTDRQRREQPLAGCAFVLDVGARGIAASPAVRATPSTP